MGTLVSIQDCSVRHSNERDNDLAASTQDSECETFVPIRIQTMKTTDTGMEA